ncbi:hypothetical protein GA0070616_1348 [Micromonospora nigra]|uniref:Uncharacterized protein n=1 Tax=Micromonospora nigra TaxID=145857 RepID=A0A1C6RKN9_9ACTN|nr:hypothetical protein [Micromonospora nigra]SCL17741.1 hypothetical protein GA0070616_1348 [Micromonospora nigra]
MQTATASLIVAICGLVLACLSLGWQAANYVLTGGRVKVRLRVGAMNAGGMITAHPRNLNPEWLADIARQGYPQPIVAVEVANVGRLPVTVTRWKLTHARGPSFVPIGESIGKPLPCRLDVGESETWAVGLDVVANVARAAQAAFKSGGFGIVGAVELADGRERQSIEKIELR